MDMDEIFRLLTSFHEVGLEYAIIGGVALNLHGIPRTTEDLDFFVRPTAENIERLRRALHAVYDDPSIDEISTEDLLGDYPSVRYLPPGTELFMDILTRLGEVATYDGLEIVEIEFNGVPVRLISPRMLFELKRDTVRTKDKLDAVLLNEKFNLNDD